MDSGHKTSPVVLATGIAQNQVLNPTPAHDLGTIPTIHERRPAGRHRVFKGSFQVVQSYDWGVLGSRRRRGPHWRNH